jgi:hypothetical protein
VSGNGEGKMFLGFTIRHYRRLGNASFNNVFPGAGGAVITGQQL